MVIKTSKYETEVVFDYTWKQVVQAYWNRYPNPSSTHVLTEDTISREVRDGKLYSRRILSKINHVPKWGERFYKNTPVKIIEDSVLDPKQKTLTTFTRNIGMKKIMRVDEIVEYSEQQDGRTLAVRRAYISSQVFGFSRAIRAFGIERFKSNCHKAAAGFNYVLQHKFPNYMAKRNNSNNNNSSSSGNVTNAITNSAFDASTIKSEHHTTSQHQPQQHSKVESIKKAGKCSYEYLKVQANKLAQMFSVKN